MAECGGILERIRVEDDGRLKRMKVGSDGWVERSWVVCDGIKICFITLDCCAQCV